MKNNDVWKFVCPSAYHTLKETVDGAVNGAVIMAVFRSVERVVNDAQNNAMFWAVRQAAFNDPLHPALNEFLTANQDAS